MATNNADQTVTVRLAKGKRDRVVALTGQPFSRLVRFIVDEVIKREEAKLAASNGSGDARVDLKHEVSQAVAKAD